MKNSEIEMNSSKEKVPFWGAVIKGSLVALSVCLILILVFAFVLKFCAVSDSLIKPINQVIKIVSILFGVFVGLKKSKEMGLMTGLIIGFLFTIIAFLSFSILDGQFDFNISLLNDCLFGSIIGAISGIIAVNFGSGKNK